MPKTAVRSLNVVCFSLMALGLLLMPAAPARAQSMSEPVTPPAPTAPQAWRLEHAWLREQRLYDRLEFMFDHIEQRIQNGQQLIDRAEANGKDITSVQAALDAFSTAIQGARPGFQSAKGILSAHKGFDANGNVVDAGLASQTVEEMGQALRGIRDELLDPSRALRDALRAFREANRPQ